MRILEIYSRRLIVKRFTFSALLNAVYNMETVYSMDIKSGKTKVKLFLNIGIQFASADRDCRLRIDVSEQLQGILYEALCLFLLDKQIQGRLKTDRPVLGEKLFGFMKNLHELTAGDRFFFNEELGNFPEFLPFTL